MPKRSHYVNGEEILRLRTTRAWSQEKLADKIGCDVKTVIKAESGGPILLRLIGDFAKALDVEPTILMTLDQTGTEGFKADVANIATWADNLTPPVRQKFDVSPSSLDRSDSSSRIDSLPNTFPDLVVDAWLLGGCIGGAVVGFAYYFRYPFVGVIRVALVIAYGVFAGGVFGAATQVGVPSVARLFGKYSFIPRSTWAQTVLLCMLSGVLVGGFGAVFFWAQGLGSPVLSWQLCVLGFLLATVVVEMGAIFHKFKWSVRAIFRAIGTCLAIAFAHFAIGALVVLAFEGPLDSAFAFAKGGSQFFAGCLIGALIGGLMGSQMCLTVALFGLWQKTLGN